MTTFIRPPWIDERLHALPARPWRKIHLDFHNSQYMPRIGDAFDADEFGDRLLEGHVDSIVVFAKDMHGYFYYPSDYGPVHPALTFDLLGPQVAACRKRGIKVYAYYCVTWDNYLAEHHPEWLVWKRDRTTYLPKFDQAPGWTALCLSNTDFVDVVLDHSREILSRYELDGIWYDMPLPIDGECFCRNCMATLRTRGNDPFDVSAQRHHKQELLTDFMRRTHTQAQELRPGCQVDQNNQTRLGLGERAPYMGNIDIEALPTAFWGYLYFPTNVRYARTFGVSVCGMTGRFQRAWADFGGLKHPNQLRAELAGIIAQGAQCDIGDQLPPSGRLDPAVYATIGQCYAEIERLEPFLTDAAPVTEAAIVVSGLVLEDFGTTDRPTADGTDDSSVLGCVKLLTESRVQFDIVEATTDLERYRLLVLPDTLRVDADLAERLRAYRQGGGAVIASHHSLRLHNSDTLWSEEIGLTYAGESPFAPCYLRPDAALGGTIPEYDFALYDGAARWLPEPGHEQVRLATLGEPLFQRSAEHYTSHAQTPFDHLTPYAAVALNHGLAATAFPVGTSYYRNGYWVYRAIFNQLVRSVLPVRLVETNAPISAEVSLTHQRANSQHPARWMAHIVNFSPVRRSPAHPEYLDDPIPLHDVWLDLALDAPIARAFLASDNTPLALEATATGCRVTVPRIEISAVVVLERAD